MAQVFEVEERVRDYELDQYGVVNNAVYLNYLEHARHLFLGNVGIDTAAAAMAGESLALSEIHLQFRSPLRSKERFRIRVTIGAITGARVTFVQRIVRLSQQRSGAESQPVPEGQPEPAPQPVLEARAVAVFVDARGRPKRVSPAHREAFSPYLEQP
ncbi:MAG TPA: thioesterase family protein [bacterium]|nr:thioesterase family protein [bacterium]